MTEQEKLTMLRTMVGTSESDEVLSTYLKLAGKKIIRKAYPYDNTVIEVPIEYDELQLEIAVYLINKRGMDYQTGHSENSINRSYESGDIPSSMLQNIVPFVGLVK